MLGCIANDLSDDRFTRGSPDPASTSVLCKRLADFVGEAIDKLLPLALPLFRLPGGLRNPGQRVLV